MKAFMISKQIIMRLPHFIGLDHKAYSKLNAIHAEESEHLEIYSVLSSRSFTFTGYLVHSLTAFHVKIYKETISATNRFSSLDPSSISLVIVKLNVNVRVNINVKVNISVNVKVHINVNVIVHVRYENEVGIKYLASVSKFRYTFIWPPLYVFSLVNM